MGFAKYMSRSKRVLLGIDMEVLGGFAICNSRGQNVPPVSNTEVLDDDDGHFNCLQSANGSLPLSGYTT